MDGILLDIETRDLVIESGTLAFGEITNQSLEHLLLANGGEFKSEPTLGAGIDRVRGASEHYARLWASNTKVMLRGVGIMVNKIEVTATGLTIN